MSDFTITEKERLYLRDLAKKQLEYAKMPKNIKREKLWYDHNQLHGEKPPVIIETGPFVREMFPPLVCETKTGKDIEFKLLKQIINYELVDDDKVIPDYFRIQHKINMKEHNMDIKVHHAVDKDGRTVGYHQDNPIKDLKKDFHLLQKSVYSYDAKYTKENVEFVENLFGDILPVKIINNSLNWFITYTARAVNIMGLERLMYSMIDYPDLTHKMLEFIYQDSMEYVDWQQEQGLLTLNNNNIMAGSGSYGFTNQLPTENYKKTGKITTKDLWGNMNSQESVGISPTMFKEFIFPYFQKTVDRFGLIYYGCCEPVHEIWDCCLSKIPNLRKVSISPWCDEEYMGQALKGTNVIYSRKPSPNYIGVGSLDEGEFRKHITKTLKAAKGLETEIIFRDIYTVNNEKYKVKKAINITRELIENLW